jgi:hypothetical protein
MTVSMLLDLQVEQQYVEVKDRLAVSASFASEFDDSFF